LLAGNSKFGSASVSSSLLILDNDNELVSESLSLEWMEHSAFSIRIIIIITHCNIVLLAVKLFYILPESELLDRIL